MSEGNGNRGDIVLVETLKKPKLYKFQIHCGGINCGLWQVEAPDIDIARKRLADNLAKGMQINLTEVVE